MTSIETPPANHNYLIGIFDILGFTEKVRKFKIDEILNKYEQQFSEGFKVKSKLFDFEYCYFSDTFLIWKREPQSIRESLLILLEGLKNLYERLVINDLVDPWFFRGCITYGDCRIHLKRNEQDSQNSVVLGRPLIDAYEIGNKLNFIGVTIHNIFGNIIPPELIREFEQAKIIYYYDDIPTKNGRIQGYVLNWVQNSTGNILGNLESRLKNISDTTVNLEVKNKLDETLRFILRVKQHVP